MKECVEGCGKYYFFRRAVSIAIHSAPTAFHRLVNIGGQGFNIPELMSVAINSFPDYYRKLVLCQSIRSMSTGDDTPPTICPTAVIVDVGIFLASWLLFIDSEIDAKFIYFPILQSVREITGRNVPIWNWWTSGAYVALYLFGPEKYGGLGDVSNKARDVAAATGRDVEEVTKEVDPYFQYH